MKKYINDNIPRIIEKSLRNLRFSFNFLTGGNEWHFRAESCKVVYAIWPTLYCLNSLSKCNILKLKRHPFSVKKGKESMRIFGVNEMFLFELYYFSKFLQRPSHGIFFGLFSHRPSMTRPMQLFLIQSMKNQRIFQISSWDKNWTTGGPNFDLFPLFKKLKWVRSWIIAK